MIYSSRKFVCALLVVIVGRSHGQQWALSPSEEFQARITKLESAKRAEGRNTFTVELLDSKGRTQYTLTKEVPFDVPYPDVYLTDKGGAMLVNGFYGTVDFYDNEGTSLKSVRFFKEDAPEYERVLQAGVSQDVIAFAASGPNTNGTQLALYDADGNPIWEKRFPGDLAYRVEVLPKDTALAVHKRFIVMSHYSAQGSGGGDVTSTILDRSGNILAEIPILFRHAHLSIPAKLLALSDQTRVLVLGTDDFREQFRWEVPEEDRSRVVTAVAVGRTGLVAVQTAAVTFEEGAAPFQNPAVFVLEVDRGTVLDRTEFSGVSFKTTTMRAEGENLNVRFDHEKRFQLRMSR